VRRTVVGWVLAIVGLSVALADRLMWGDWLGAVAICAVLSPAWVFALLLYLADRLDRRRARLILPLRLTAQRAALDGAVSVTDGLGGEVSVADGGRVSVTGGGAA
jgi:hypothetical protein